MKRFSVYVITSQHFVERDKSFAICPARHSQVMALTYLTVTFLCTDP